MTNKKRFVALLMVVVLALTTVIGTTLAYFKDTDDAKNVMTLGKVEIEQLEKDKEGKPFEQDQPLFPMVDEREDKEADPVVDGWFDTKMDNVIDKVITVENKGTLPAYVRTVLAFETARHYVPGSDTEFTDMHKTYIGTLTKNVEYTDEYITVDGVEYILAVCVYEDPLAAGKESDPSLKQFFLAPTAGNEAYDIFGDEYTILAVSQAVQVEGFDTAEEALNEAFGEVTAANAAAWF